MPAFRRIDCRPKIMADFYHNRNPESLAPPVPPVPLIQAPATLVGVARTLGPIGPAP